MSRLAALAFLVLLNVRYIVICHLNTEARSSHLAINLNPILHSTGTVCDLHVKPEIARLQE